MQIIAGKFKGRVLKSPKGAETRPTSSKLRGAVFNRHQSAIVNANVLDIFAGSGAVGLEALSRGANKAVFVDNNRFAIEALKANILSLGVGNDVQVIQSDFNSALPKINEEFDFVYADPPYQLTKGLKRPQVLFIEQLLDFFEESALLKPGGILLIEEGGPFQLNKEFRTLVKTDERIYGSTWLYEFSKSLPNR